MAGQTQKHVAPRRSAVGALILASWTNRSPHHLVNRMRADAGRLFLTAARTDRIFIAHSSRPLEHIDLSHCRKRSLLPSATAGSSTVPFVLAELTGIFQELAMTLLGECGQAQGWWETDTLNAEARGLHCAGGLFQNAPCGCCA